MNVPVRWIVGVGGAVLLLAAACAWWLWPAPGGRSREGASVTVPRGTRGAGPEGAAPPGALREVAETECVSVLSWSTREPIRGARVSLLDDRQQEPVVVVTGDTGDAYLPVGAAARVQVTAEGYLPRTLDRAVVARGPVLLAPSGALVLEFLDEEGAPVEGLRVALLLPAAVQELCTQGLWSERAAVRPASDAAGQVRWEALPAVERYRWQCHSPVVLEPSPPYEVQEFEPLPQGFEQHSVPSGRSGEFAIEHRRETRLRCHVFRTTTLLGTLVCGPLPAPPPEVVLYHERVIPNAAGSTVTFFAQEAASPVDAASEFVFRGVRPGRKRLAAALHRDRHWYFAKEDLEVASGEQRRVFLRVPEPDESVELNLVFVEEAGAPLDPGAARDFRGRQVPGMHAALFNLDVAASGHSSLVVDLPLEGAAWLHGLDAGTWQVQIGRSSMAQAAPEGFEPAESLVTRRFTVPAVQPVEIVVALRRSCSLRLQVRYPSGVEPFDFSLEFLERGTGRTARTSVLAAELEDDGGLPLQLAAGDYVAVAVFPDPGDPGPGRDFAWSAVVSVDPRRTSPLVVEFQRGVTLRGRLVDPAGAPRARASLWLTPEAWIRPDQSRWLHAVTTDAQGEFRVTGLVPQSWYHVKGSAGSGTSPERLYAGPGGEQEVELVLQRRDE